MKIVSFSMQIILNLILKARATYQKLFKYGQICCNLFFVLFSIIYLLVRIFYLECSQISVHIVTLKGRAKHVFGGRV